MPFKPALDYDAAWHLHCRIALRSGRGVLLESLAQSQTYAGWLEGSPRADINDRIVDAVRLPGVLLVEPKRRDHLREPGDMADMPFGPAEWLPLVTCTARFRSAQGARDVSKHSSSLTVTWFQDEFALPIDPAVLDRIRELDWNALAADCDDE